MSFSSAQRGSLAAQPSTVGTPGVDFGAALQRSYLKTITVSAVVGVVAILLAHRVAFSHPTILRLLIEGIGWSLGLGLEMVAASGILVVARELGHATGRRDLFLAVNSARSEHALLAKGQGSSAGFGRRVRHALGQPWPLVGEDVQIRSREEIAATLDANGCLNGLPFMPEMAALCGRTARVFRCVDKVYDYGGDKTLRRIDDVVLLADFRCDGSAHGGCQASCYILWKREWLSPVNVSPLVRSTPGAAVIARVPAPPLSGDRYTCQFTQLVAASRPMRRGDILQDLRPLRAGNVGLAAFCVAMLTRAFNAVQRARGGVTYPAMESPHETANSNSRRACSPCPGAIVRVRSRAEIRKTLNARGYNRGLWFDRDMAKHCGRRYTVLRRVDRIIDDVTGRMLKMKHPCLVLDGVDSSGEFLRFAAQHEYPFWREDWLEAESALSSEVRG